MPIIKPVPSKLYKPQSWMPYLARMFDNRLNRSLIS